VAFFYLCVLSILTLKFDPYTLDLPVLEILKEVKETFTHQNTLIVHAPTGAGKSTVLPLSLLEEPFLKGKKILMLEPRRLATKSIAMRMADLYGEKVGQTVGYRIRFENQTSSQTRLEVLTEGILTRMLHSDNALEDVGLVIFDEFHERNIHADVAMALCREAQQILRPDLRIMVMSATLDMPQLSGLLQAPVVSSQGKIFPVDIRYSGDYDPWTMPENVANVVFQAAKSHEGDILVFLPGQGEIKKTEALLRRLLPEFRTHPLYGQLSPSAQFQAVMPNRHGQRKIVLATSIAETSLTIEGVTVVVDSGYGRTSKFDPKSGLSRLETVRIAKDSADQRTGRAGRLGPGTCIRMWSKATHLSLADYRTPEILEADLAFLVLDMVLWGIKNIQELTWLTPPPSGMLSQAFDILHQLEALKDGKITAHGKKIHEIPAHPRIAHMLVKAGEDNKIALATDIAALLEERDPLDPNSGVDINLRIESLRRSRKENLFIKGFNKIEKVASNYRKMFRVDIENLPVDPYETGLLIALAYPERIASARPGNNAQFQLANGKIAMIGHQDDLAHEPWLAVSHIDAREGMGKIFLASPLNPKDLAPLVKEKRVISWDTKKGGLIATTNLAIGNIILRSIPMKEVSDSDRISAISKAIAQEWESLMPVTEEFVQLLNRIGSLRIWRKEENWPDWTMKVLFEKDQKWLTHYLANVRKNEDLKKLNLPTFLYHHLTFEQQKDLDELAPKKYRFQVAILSKSNIGKRVHLLFWP
jgi:ATP-dependent helicase HrpB